MNFWDWQAKKLKVDVADPKPPELKVEELPPLGFEEGIKVEESAVSDTFVGRMRADLRKLWGATMNHDDNPGASTKFERWVQAYGAARLEKQLAGGANTKVSLGEIYAWVRGEHEPRPIKRRALILFAAGELTHEDLDAHFAAKNKK
jgi:hypothetical protein